MTKLGTLRVLALATVVTMPVRANAQSPFLNPGLSVSAQAVTTGREDRSGGGLSFAEWIGRNPLLRGRAEVGFGGYSLVGGGYVCVASSTTSTDCAGTGPDGFPELWMAGASVVVGDMARRRFPLFASLGLTGIAGMGTPRRTTNRATIAPDAGVGLAVGRWFYAEYRLRWTSWAGGNFRMDSFGVGIRR